MINEDTFSRILTNDYPNHIKKADLRGKNLTVSEATQSDTRLTSKKPIPSQ
jgi:hypothetical protein